MALPRAFISFDYEHDLPAKNLFAGQCKVDSPTPFAAADWSSKEPLPQAEWERLVSAKIRKCDFLIVLVGTHMATATGVHKEINFGKQHGLPMFGVYVNGASPSSVLPPGLKYENVTTWTWDRIARLVDQCVKK